MTRKAERKAAEQAQRRRENEVVGKAILNVRSEGASRSGADAHGHTWITLTGEEVPQEALGEVPAQTAVLLKNYHEASVGFHAADPNHPVDRDTAGVVKEPDDATNPTARKEFNLTLKQFRKLYQYINSHRNHKYNAGSYTSTTFATHALKAAGLAVSKHDTVGGAYKDMYEEAKANAKKRNPSPCAVKLKKLAAGQAHNARGAAKEGAAGNARIAGVDGFQMRQFNVLDTFVMMHKDAGQLSAANFTKFILQTLQKNSGRSLEFTHTIVNKARAFGLIHDEQHQAILLILNVGAAFSKASELEDNLALSYIQCMRAACGASENTFQAILNSKNLVGPSLKSVVSHLTRKTIGEHGPADVIASIQKLYNSFVEVSPQIGDMAKAALGPMIRDCKEYTRDNLEKFRLLLERNGNNWPAEIRDVYAFLHTYFNTRIKEKNFTQQDYDDAMMFQESFPIPQLRENMPILAQAIKTSSQHRFYSRIYGDNNIFLDTNAKAQRAEHKAREVNGFEVMENENEIVADVYVNVDTETKSRSYLGVKDFFKSNVGHTWLTISQRTDYLPGDLEDYLMRSPFGGTTVNLMNTLGSTAIGFWPLQFDNSYEKNEQQLVKKLNKTTDEEKREELEGKRVANRRAEILNKARKGIRKTRGYTTGNGDSDGDRTAIGYSLGDVRGKVEEPDDAHTPKSRKKFSLTRFQFRQVFDYINAHRNANYNLRNYNCTTFAAEAVRAAGYTIGGTTMGIQLPNAMYRSFYKEAKEEMEEREEQEGQQGQNAQPQSDLEFLELGPDEAHRKVSPSKMGGGEDVRIKGVKAFNMVSRYLNESESYMYGYEITERADDKEFFRTGFKSSLILERFKLSDIQMLNILHRATTCGAMTKDELTAFNAVLNNKDFEHYRDPSMIPLTDSGFKALDYIIAVQKFVGKDDCIFNEMVDETVEKIFQHNLGSGLVWSPRVYTNLLEKLRVVYDKHLSKRIIDYYLKTGPTMAIVEEAIYLSAFELDSYDVYSKILCKVVPDRKEALNSVVNLYTSVWYDDDNVQGAMANIILNLFQQVHPDQYPMELIEQFHQRNLIHEADYLMIMDGCNQMRQVYQNNPDYKPEKEDF